MINPDFFDCELEGYELVSETNVIDCPDGSTMECGGPGYVCQNQIGDFMHTIPADPAVMTEIIEAPETPELPEMPETPEIPEMPEAPEVPEMPEAPEVPEMPESPEVPEMPETPDMPADTGPCADKACGDSCSTPCPPGLMCPTVMKYCQADGSCGNAMPTPSGCGATIPAVPAPIPADTCDKSDWPDVKANCGGCSALVINIQTEPSYQNCDGYCSSVGRICKGEYEEVSNSCSISIDESSRLTCTTVFEDTNDLICECGDLKPESTCDKEDWTDMKVDCGGCTALVHNFETYKTCNGYCASVGLQCVAAADDKRNTCYAQEDKNLSCDSTFDLFGGSSHDALCTCGGELPKPETPEAPEILKPAKVCKGLRRKDCDANTVCRWSKQKQKCKVRPEPEKAEKENRHNLLESTHEEKKTFSTALILAVTGISFFLGFFLTYTKMKQRTVENVDMEYLNMAEA